MKYWGRWKGWAGASRWVCVCVWVFLCDGECLTVEIVDVVSAPPNQNKHLYPSPLSPQCTPKIRKVDCNISSIENIPFSLLFSHPTPPSCSPLSLLSVLHQPDSPPRFNLILIPVPLIFFFLYISISFQISTSHLSDYSPSLSALSLSLCFPISPQSCCGVFLCVWVCVSSQSVSWATVQTV